MCASASFNHEVAYLTDVFDTRVKSYLFITYRPLQSFTFRSNFVLPDTAAVPLHATGEIIFSRIIKKEKTNLQFHVILPVYMPRLCVSKIVFSINGF